MADRTLLRSGTALAPPAVMRPGEVAYSPGDWQLWIADGAGIGQRTAAGSFGTVAGTYAQGNDARILGALPAATAATTYATIAADALKAPLANPAFTGVSGSVNAGGGPSGATIVPGTVFQLIAGAAGLGLDSLAGSSSIGMRRANGTAGTPTAMGLGDQIAGINIYGYGTTGYSASSRASVRFIAGAAWTDTDQSTAITFGTTAVGTTTNTERMRVHASGRVSIGTNGDDGVNALQVIGTAAASDLNIAGSGNMAGAWTTGAPAVTSSTGVLTAVSCVSRFKKFGRTVFFNATVTITTNGTGAGQIQVPMPFAAVAGLSALNGRRGDGPILGCVISGSTAFVTAFDGTYSGGNGASLVISGNYEAAT